MLRPPVTVPSSSPKQLHQILRKSNEQSGTWLEHISTLNIETHVNAAVGGVARIMNKAPNFVNCPPLGARPTVECHPFARSLGILCEACVLGLVGESRAFERLPLRRRSPERPTAGALLRKTLARAMTGWTVRALSVRASSAECWKKAPALPSLTTSPGNAKTHTDAFVSLAVLDSNAIIDLLHSRSLIHSFGSEFL